MVILTFLIGLPGSGKSHLLSEFHEKGYYIIDDFYSTAENLLNPESISQSNIFIKNLENGVDCIVADISFCDPYILNTFILYILDLNIPIKINFIYFENNPEKCRTNVHNDSSPRNKDDRLMKIDELTKIYNPTKGSKEIFQRINNY